MIPQASIPTPSKGEPPRDSDSLPAVDRNSQRVAVSELDARRVWVAAGGRCTFCKEFVAGDETTGQSVFTGQLAHIVGATTGKKSPRGKSDRSPAERALPANLMLLCPGEHKVVDTYEHWATYDEGQLLAIKKQHEKDVHELTGLLRKPKTTVVRVSGNIRGQAVDFSKQAVIRALLDEQRFPDFSLHDDSENCEVDLRFLVGEDDSHTTYWNSAALTLERRLRPLNNHLKTKQIDHISVFALARTPILIQLGVLLDDVTNVTVHNRGRGIGDGWGWYGEGPTDNLRFAVTEVMGEGDPVVIFGVSGPVDIAALPEELQGRPRYDIKPEGVGPNPKVLRSPEDMEALIDTWREVLATLEENHRNRPISLIVAACAAASVEIGRAHMAGSHAPLRVFDRVDSTYTFALETS